MTQFFSKKLNKKGFTLAELLIVVAIIAILVAIAFPIFTSALERAQVRTNEANAKTLKSAATNYIFEHWDDETNAMSAGVTYGWVASGTFDTEGNLTNVVVTPQTYAHYNPTDYPPVIVKGENAAKLEAGKFVSDSGSISPTYTITVYIDDVSYGSN